MLTPAIRLFEQGALDRAEDLFLHALQQGEAEEALLYLARIAFTQDRPDEAVAFVERAIPLAPSPLALAQRLMEQQLAQLAEPACRVAARQAPDDMEAQIWLGHALSVQNKLTAAVRAYEKAIVLDTRATLPRYCLACTLMALGELGRAASQVQVILQAAPQDSDALLLRADLAFLQGDFRQAAAEYQRAIEAGKIEPEIVERLATSWWNAGDRGRALEIYEAGFAAFPIHWDLYEEAARMCEEAGWFTKARRYHLALTYEPSRREAARRALARLKGLRDAAPAPALVPAAAPAVAADTPRGLPDRDSVTARLRAGARSTGPLGRPGTGRR